MSKLHAKTGSTCMLCEETPNNRIVFHRTRRQTHAVCLDCGIGYLKPLLTQATNNICKNIRKDNDVIKCPGTVKGLTRNMCRHKISLGNLLIPECEISADITRIIYVMKTPTAYICPEAKCGKVIVIQEEYTGNNIMCHDGCKTSWCRNCLISPFHTGKSCIEIEAETSKTENGKLIWELYSEGKLKYCPCCREPCIKNSGCNKMLCASCGKTWCWLCLTLNIEYEHYNRNNQTACTGKLWHGVNTEDNAGHFDDY